MSSKNQRAWERVAREKAKLEERVAALESDNARLRDAVYNAQHDIFISEKALICTDLCNALGHANNCAWIHDKANKCNCGGNAADNGGQE